MKSVMTGILLVGVCGVMCLCSGCDKMDGSKGEPLDFTVVGKKDIPQELAELIAERQMGEFKLSYSNEAELYIVVGYGEQDCGGYSIEVPSVSFTDTEIIVDTNLVGPSEKQGGASYPYIVLKTEYRDLPIVFE